MFEQLEELLIVLDMGVDIVLCVVVNMVEGCMGWWLFFKEIKILLVDEVFWIMELVVCLLLFYVKKFQVVLVVGVNGLGKIMIIGKLVSQFCVLGKFVVIVVGDIFCVVVVE